MANGNIVLDLTNYKDRTSARVPQDTYRVIVDDVEVGTANLRDPKMQQKLGRDTQVQLSVYLRIHGGDFDGMTIVDRLYPENEKALFRVVGFMQALGLKTPRKRLSFNPQGWVGKSLEIVTRDGQPYNNQIRSEVASYARLTSGAGASSDASDIEDIEDADDSDDAEDVTEETAEVEETEEVDETPEPAPKAKARKREPEPEEDDAQGEVDLDDIDNL